MFGVGLAVSFKDVLSKCFSEDFSDDFVVGSAEESHANEFRSDAWSMMNESPVSRLKK